MSAADRFLGFHASNPHVYELLAARARRWMRERGGKQSLQVHAEAVRWHDHVPTTGDRYRINNSFRPFYSRLLMLCEDDLRGAFEIRRSKADAATHPGQGSFFEAGDDWLEQAAAIVQEHRAQVAG